MQPVIECVMIQGGCELANEIITLDGVRKVDNGVNDDIALLDGIFLYHDGGRNAHGPPDGKWWLLLV